MYNLDTFTSFHGFAATEDGRPPGCASQRWDGDRPRSPKGRATQMTVTSCNTAVGDDRPPVSRVAVSRHAREYVRMH